MALEPPMARARRLAREAKLQSISFLDAAGHAGARGTAVHTVVLAFAGGSIVRLTPRELAALRDVEFRLEQKDP